MNFKLRIVMVISGYPPVANAGAEHACQRLSHALGRRGHEVIVLTQAAEDVPEVQEEAPGVRVYRVLKPLAIGPLWGLTYMNQVRRWLLRLARDWDLVLCHQLYLHSIPANAVARKLGKKSASLLVNAGVKSDITRLGAHRFGARLVRAALRTDALFALSNIIASELYLAGIAPERIWRYRNFVDVQEYAPRGTEIRDGFLYVGRFHPQKNVPGLIESFALLHARRPEARLRLIGGGPSEAEVMVARQQSSARQAISIDSWTGNPSIAYGRALATVSATTTEGLSNVMIEAMACGTPVIITDVSGARDALDPRHELPSLIGSGEFAMGTGGIIVPTGDKEALAKAMELFLSDGRLRAQLGAEARSRAVENYSETVSTESFINMARKIMNEEPASGEERGFPPALFASESRGS